MLDYFNRVSCQLMKDVPAFVLFLFFTACASLVIVLVAFSLKTGVLALPQFGSVKDISGMRRYASTSVYTPVSVNTSTEIGLEASNDNFAVAIESFDSDFEYEQWEAFELIYGKQAEPVADADMIYKNAFSEEPLVPRDYYYGKFENAVAGINGINKIPVLKPGNSIGLIRDKYINIKPWNGFVQPPGYYFASGVCWSSSALGFLQDNSNKAFREKYGVDLFTFKRGDRAPHTDYYETYGGGGYTMLQISEGNPAQDYRFTVNPVLANMPELADIKIKIVMVSSSTHEKGYKGQSIGGYILSNKEF